MITQLYIERVADGVYEVVCNDLMIGPVGSHSWLGTDVESAIEVLIDPHRDEFEYADDICGVRFGYHWKDGMAIAAFKGEAIVIPEFRIVETLKQFRGQVQS